MKSWRVIIDVANCEDCNNCLLACKDEHLENDWPGYTQTQPRHGHRWIDIARSERGQFPLIDVAYLPTMCMHCDDAACMKILPGAVYKRQDGIVMIDPKKAKGHRELVHACPYNMIWWNEAENVPQKCTFCAHLIDDGWSQTRCSQACPTGALRMELMEDLEFARLVEREKLEVLHPEYEARPRVYYKNLYRYTKCFIAGSIAVNKAGVVDCVPGARITLLQNQTKIAESLTDAYGDFRFDKLQSGGCDFLMEIDAAGYPKKTASLEVLKTSINLGTIFLSQGMAERTAR